MHNASKTLIYIMLFRVNSVNSVYYLPNYWHRWVIILLGWYFVFRLDCISRLCGFISGHHLIWQPLCPQLWFNQRSYNCCAWVLLYIVLWSPSGGVMGFIQHSSKSSSQPSILCCVVQCEPCAYTTRMCESLNNFICHSKRATLQSDVLYLVPLSIVLKRQITMWQIRV